MKRDNWLVGEESIRPAGSPLHCFYCGVERNGQHTSECVIRKKTVVIKLEIELVVEVPETWEQDNIEFRYNESSYCFDNIIRDLKNLSKRVGCLCNFAKVIFLREATIEDEQNQKKSVKKIPS